MESSLPEMFETIRPVRPAGEDAVRQIWIRAQRGTIEDYGDFEEFREEGIVETRDEFEQHWRFEYPDPFKWYHIATSQYKDQRFVFFDHKLALQYTPNPEQRHNHGADRKLVTFLSWLCEEIKKEITVIRKDPEAYQRFLGINLPYEKRTGKILRSTFWKIAGDDIIRLDKELAPDVVSDLEKVVEQGIDYNRTPGIPEISASGFLHLCEICYNANDYFRSETIPLSPMEQYRRMADMRHGGLTEIDQDSTEAFRNWYHRGQKVGAHPWEICRGGNSTHISLMLSSRGNDWILSLAGSSIVRVAETARMAAALYRHGVPFYLRDGKEILDMVLGKDYIGIVPDHVLPRYCHGLFPAKDRIIDFMNLPFEFRDKVIHYSIWYPIDKVQVI
ncbi:MAG: hypothetical protein K9G38_07875 [Bacteroidales bacterium]|nr:hypothetical protein [Bacteroidales bacterium]